MYYDDIDFDAINKGQSDTKKCDKNKISLIFRQIKQKFIV